ncbi:MAG TPA: deoxynucleoside kinase [Flavipsychrobacter sp.]|nr:deoxynucleoside kinase [Flavipsychrobacter sp.]
MHYRYIAVEGNIAAGKSTLASLLATHYNAKLMLEEFADNTFLPKFYHEKERYAFPLELSFLTDRYKQMKRTLLQQELFHEKVVSDYILLKSKLFAKINLPADEYALFEKIYKIAETNLPEPDLVIFLYSPIKKLQENIKKRARSYEQNIQDSYLQDVQNMYDEYLELNLQKCIFIDVTQVDFVHNPSHFHQLIQVLNQPATARTHYLEIL